MINDVSSNFQHITNLPETTTEHNMKREAKSRTTAAKMSKIDIFGAFLVRHKV